MVLVPALPEEAPPTRPVPEDVVPEASPAPEMIDVQPGAPRVPSEVVYETSGALVSRRVPTGLRSVLMPAVSPSVSVTA